MDTVKGLLAIKGSHVWAIGPEATVLHGALLMRQHGVGSLVVLEHDQVAGIITERDVLQRVICEQRDPARTAIGEVMTQEVYCCEPGTPLEEVRSAFKTRRLRHLPVVDGERHLVGLISIGDLNAHLVADQEGTIFALTQYLYGRV